MAPHPTPPLPAPLSPHQHPPPCPPTPPRRKDERNEPTKVAIGMFSGETEPVEFDADCICDGPVENWLQCVVDSMKQALIAEFRKAVPTYDEEPRTKWLYKYSAQNTIVVTRTFFTQEVNEAFDELEEGKWVGGGGLGWEAGRLSGRG